MLLGITSPKSKIKVVTPAVAMIGPHTTPKATTAMMVPSVAAPTFTRLLPSKTVARNLSGLSAALASCLAPLTPLSTRYLMRSLGKEIKAASALEKKAEKARQIRKANKSQLSPSSN